MSAMREVEASYVHPCPKKPLQHLHRPRRRSQRADNLSLWPAILPNNVNSQDLLHCALTDSPNKRERERRKVRKRKPTVFQKVFFRGLLLRLYLDREKPYLYFGSSSAFPCWARFPLLARYYLLRTQGNPAPLAKQPLFLLLTQPF
jgi:hypothetical protein